MMRSGASTCVFAMSLYFFTIVVCGQITHRKEVSALMAIKHRLDDPMKHLQNWNKGDPCTFNWTGVLCFERATDDGYLHVQELQLLNKNLSGNLAPELGQLSQLHILDFMWNELSGSIPKEIGNILSLRLLLLNGNKLSGSLPYELGYLSRLDRLQIDQNLITGSIPESFSNLRNVKHLHMNNNSLSGSIPPQLSNLSILLHLLLENNNISGRLPPELSSISALQILQLDNNNMLTGEIPASYGSMTALVKLSLRNCSLQGSVPDLSRISNFSYLDLSSNQLTGPIPSNRLSTNMTTIDLSNNQLNGTIPKSFSELPSLQKLSLGNNSLTGSVPASIWRNMSFSAKARRLLDFRNNALSNVVGDLSPSQNVTLWLQGNPICKNANIKNVSKFCGPQSGGDDIPWYSNSTSVCLKQGCPSHNNFEYVPTSPLRCFCAAPIWVGYRLKSPSFTYFPPYRSAFEMYLTSSLNMDLYQLSIYSYTWDKGSRLWMYLKLFPAALAASNYSNTFNGSEIQRIRGIFTSWHFPRSELFGPYELLNFTLLEPYSYMNIEPQAKGLSKVTLVAIVLAAAVCAVIASVALTFFIVRRHVKTRYILSRRRMSSRLSIKIDGVKNFTFQEMALATQGFDKYAQVGQGGYGKVYKGILSDNTVVAIKRAKEGSLQGQKEFLTEIELLSRLHHRNLVSLLGYCDEKDEQMLVYEFMPNGNLRDWLSAESKEKILHFAVRLRIALDSAKSILYLHTEANPPIFHRDIKATNILLDTNLIAKVSDFGLSRLAPVLDEDGNVPNYVSTIVKGTPGYLDPEYLLTHKLTDKSDVYSLGVVFLELLTGMQPIAHGKHIVREVNLAHHSGTIFTIIDSKMGSYPSECIERFVSLALRCCQDNVDERPSMLDVVRELENIIRMMPETVTDSLEPSLTYFSESKPSSSFISRDHPYTSSSVSGGDLISGEIPTITPR